MKKPIRGDRLKEVMAKACAELSDQSYAVMAELRNCHAFRLWARLLSMSSFPTWSQWHPKIQLAMETGYQKRISSRNFVQRMICILETCDSIWSPERAARFVAWMALTESLLDLGPGVAAVILAEENGAPTSSPSKKDDNASIEALSDIALPVPAALLDSEPESMDDGCEEPPNALSIPEDE